MKFKTMSEFKYHIKNLAISAQCWDVEVLCEALDIVFDAINDNEEFEEKFLWAYCARGVHDAHEGGLAEHTYKVMYHLVSMLGSPNDIRLSDFYKNIKDKVNPVALIVGALVHDIGKVYEYKGGSNSKHHYVSHPIHGVAWFTTNLFEQFQCNYGDETALRIISIIGQHHGEFGEKPQTLEAYLVHLADYQETKLQILEEAVGGGSDSPADDESDNYIISSKYIPFRLNTQGDYDEGEE